MSAPTATRAQIGVAAVHESVAGTHLPLALVRRAGSLRKETHEPRVKMTPTTDLAASACRNAAII